MPRPSPPGRARRRRRASVPGRCLPRPPAAPARSRRRRPRSSLPLLVEVEHREERLLRHLHPADLLHALLALLLLLEELALPRDVAAVALREHVLATRLDRLACDHTRTDRGLHGH